MGERIVFEKCGNKKCKQSFSVTKSTKLLKDNRAKCPFCNYSNRLSLKQAKKLIIMHLEG